MSMSEQNSGETGQKRSLFSADPPAVIEDPYAVPIADINMVDGRIFEQDRQFEFFERLRNEDPVHLNDYPETGRYWDVTKFDDILFIDKHHELFSSAHGIALGPPVNSTPNPEDMNLAMFIAMDPPKHDLQRATVNGVVAPRNLAELEPLIKQRAGRILDDLPVGETFNWVERVSVELTTQMLATLFDFPFEDRSKLTRWSDIATANTGSDVLESEQQRRTELLECLEYFTRLWNERAAKEPGNDLISMLAHGKNTRDMAPFELLGNLILLIVGGNDTTRNSISGGVLALNQNPAEYEKLRRNPDLITNMVSEIIRWQTPLPYMRRTASVDFELRGKQIKTGDQIIMWYLSGNRDEEVIADAGQFLIDRPMARHHLSFGFGIHRCMGNRLAEMQLRIVWEEIMQRFDFVEVCGPPKRLRSSFIRGITDLPVRVHRC
jgi:cytochrome P450